MSTASVNEETLETTSEDLEQRKVDESIAAEAGDVEDEDFIAPVDRRNRKSKTDIMGSISLTADRVNVSYQARTIFAASAINAMGGSIDDTNISKTTAWRKAKAVRTETANQIKTDYVPPPKGTAHSL